MNSVKFTENYCTRYDVQGNDREAEENPQE